MRELLRDLRPVAVEAGYYGLAARIDAALSQQAEPAPAQTEQQPVAIPEAVRAWMMDVPLPDNEYGYRLTNRRDELLAARPAQTEQQPVAMVDANDDGMWADILPDVTVKVGQMLYAAPIAQTAPVPSAARQILDLIMEECRYWHGRDEARRGNFANLYAAAKELADNTAPISQTATLPSYESLIQNAKALLSLDERGSLVPHGIGGLAREVIEKLVAQVEQTAPQPEQSNLEPLLNAGAALSNIAFNLAQRPGVTLDQHVCDLLSSARKHWDEARSAMAAKEG